MKSLHQRPNLLVKRGKLIKEITLVQKVLDRFEGYEIVEICQDKPD
jgi:hypothetical protein